MKECTAVSCLAGLLSWSATSIGRQEAGTPGSSLLHGSAAAQSRYCSHSLARQRKRCCFVQVVVALETHTHTIGRKQMCSFFWHQARPSATNGHFDSSEAFVCHIVVPLSSIRGSLCGIYRENSKQHQCKCATWQDWWGRIYQKRGERRLFALDRFLRFFFRTVFAACFSGRLVRFMLAVEDGRTLCVCA